MKAAIVIAASVVLGTASLGSAHEGATGVLKQRMDGMKHVEGDEGYTAAHASQEFRGHSN